MKHLYLISFLIFSTLSVTPQNYMFYGDKTFGGSNQEHGVQINKVYNKLILAGVSFTLTASGDKTVNNCNNNMQTLNSDVWIVKFEADFTQLWDNSYGGEFSENTIVISNILDNNNVIIATISSSDSSCEKTENNWDTTANFVDYWICKIDSSGNKLWDKRFGSVDSDLYPVITKLSTNDFLIVGYGADQINGDKSVPNFGLRDFWAVKFDSTGAKIWDMVYGGSGLETWHPAGGNTNGLSVASTENGSFVIGATTNSQMSGMVSGLGFGGRDIWMVKADSAGNYIWDTRFGGSTNNDFFGSMIKTQDNGFIIIGTTGSPQGGSVTDPQIGSWDVWIIKTDSLANKEWDRRYGGTGMDYGISIAEAPGGGYWISANTESPQGFDVSEPPYGILDYWIFKIDSVGNKIWDKRFGGPGYNSVSNFVIMPDSSIFLAGHADSGATEIKLDPGKGSTDYWVVHFEYSDNINTTAVNEINSYNLNIYPNPTSSELNIQFTLKESENVKLQLFNSLGEVVQEIAEQKLNAGENKINFSTEDIPPGVYYLKFNAGDKSVMRKVVKM